MVLSYLKVLWTIIHLLVSLVESGYNFGLEFREKSKNFVNFIQNIGRSKRNHDYRDDKLLIERTLVEIRKYPRHLAVILNVNKQEDVDVSQLISLTIWAMSSGTNFISFYDYKGKYDRLRNDAPVCTVCTQSGFHRISFVLKWLAFIQLNQSHDDVPKKLKIALINFRYRKARVVS